MKDLASPQELQGLSDEQLDALEQVVRREIHNIEQAKQKLDEALKNILDEKDRRRP
jgi:hypothetical protein